MVTRTILNKRIKKTLSSVLTLKKRGGIFFKTSRLLNQITIFGLKDHIVKNFFPRATKSYDQRGKLKLKLKFSDEQQKNQSQNGRFVFAFRAPQFCGQKIVSFLILKNSSQFVIIPTELL